MCVKRHILYVCTCGLSANVGCPPTGSPACVCVCVCVFVTISISIYLSIHTHTHMNK